VLNAVSAASAVGLACLSTRQSESTTTHYMKATLVLISAAGIGICSQIPPGMFYISFGAEHAGTVAANRSALACLLASAYLVLLRFVIDKAGWVVVSLIHMCFRLGGALCHGPFGLPRSRFDFAGAAIGRGIHC